MTKPTLEDVLDQFVQDVHAQKVADLPEGTSDEGDDE